MEPSLNDRASLRGRHVLVVEDETLVFMLIESILEEHGCRSAGAPRVAAALDLARQEVFDAAVLDVNVAGEPVYPVADLLAGQGVPFVFLTGYGAHILTEPYRDRPVVQKPFREGILLDALARCCTTGATEAQP